MKVRKPGPTGLIGLALLALAIVAIVGILQKAKDAAPEVIARFLRLFVKGAAIALGLAFLMRALALRLGLAFLAPWLAFAAAAAALVMSGAWNAAAGAAGLPKVPGAKYDGLCADPSNWHFEDIAGRRVGACVEWPRATVSV